MKKKILFFALISTLLANQSFGQLMTFGFVKNCMTYKRTTFTDEITKKQFFVVERTLEKASNKLLDGATYYSNEKDRDTTKGEIRVLSLISDSKQVTEITFRSGSKNDFSKNYNEVYDQMIKFFKNETSFKSVKYKTNVIKFNRDKVYYYVYNNNKISTIVISDYKIDEEYF